MIGVILVRGKTDVRGSQSLTICSLLGQLFRGKVRHTPRTWGSLAFLAAGIYRNPFVPLSLLSTRTDGSGPRGLVVAAALTAWTRSVVFIAARLPDSSSGRERGIPAMAVTMSMGCNGRYRERGGR